MPELYLRVLDRVLTPVLILVAIFLLLRGHNVPGGGFIAGLVVAVALELQIISRGDAYVRTRFGSFLHPLTGLGLLLAVSAALIGISQGGFFMGVWWEFSLGEVELDFGTPMLFDIGVFLVVVSVVTTFLLGLSTIDEEGSA